MLVKIASLRISELKEILEEHELSTQGIKSELVKRLVDALNSDEIERPDPVPIPSTTMLQLQVDNLRTMVETLTSVMQSFESRNNNIIQQPTNLETPTTSDLNSNSTTRPDAIQITETTMIRPNRNYSMKEISETIPSFDPTDRNSLSVEHFIDRVQNVLMTHQFDEKVLLLAVYSRLQGVARMWLDAHPTLFSDWSSFAEALRSEFNEQLDEAAIHDMMTKSTRSMNETPIDYCFRISALGRRHGLSDRAIIKHARAGMQHRDFQAAVAAIKFNNLTNFRETVVEFFNNYVAVTPTRPSMIHRPSMGQHKGMQRNNHETKPGMNLSGPETKPKTITCYNCLEEGHISLKCPKPSRRTRCKDCSKVHGKNEPVNCGNNLNVRRVNTIFEGFSNKIVKIRDRLVKARIDTGSECDLIKRKIADSFNDKRLQRVAKITGVGGGISTTKECVTLPIRIDDVDVNLEFHIIDDNLIDTDVLIGQPIFQNNNIRATIENGTMKFEQMRNEEREGRLVQKRNEIQLVELDCGISDQQTQVELVQLVNEYRDVFATNMDEIGKTDLEIMEIKLTSTNTTTQAPYRIPEKKKDVVSEMINELLRCDIIEPSTSNFASPILLHKKKDGSERLCVDYRRLNAMTEREVHPMPNIEEALQEAKRYKYFSVLDLNSGYYQVTIEPNSRKYTAFVTTENLYQFKRMPFGLRNAPTVFLRLMSKLKEKLQSGDMIHYMDDMLVGGNSIPEMLQKLRRVFNALREARLTLNVKKCEFMKNTITYLGHQLTPDGISPGHVKTRAIDEFPIPKCITDVRKFLGLSGYFRKFVPGFAMRSEPLRKLLRKDVTFVWNDETNRAFNDLKQALTTKPVMAAYQSDAEHAIHTDASSTGIAGVLMQLDGEKDWKPVIYYSRSTSDLEKKFHSSELETLAVVEALERFKYYVYGKPIKVLTDCNAVKSTMSKKDLIPRIGRWSLRIQEFDAVIEHRPGNRMEHVDSLSRTPVESPHEIEEATLKIDKIELDENDWLSALQLLDEKLQNIISTLKQRKGAEDEQYVVVNDRLFRKVGDKRLWVVPKQLRWKILNECHDNNGHLGLENTLIKIKNTMWFDRMRNFTKNYLNACVECAYNKHSGRRTEGEYHCDNIPTVPFKAVHMDHLGPFPRSKSRNEHILVLVDAFTKFTVIRAVPSTKTKFVLKVLHEVNSYFGTPEQIITDRGTAFTSKMFEEFCKNHDIKHIKNSVRTPRANGHAERTNRTILSALLTTSDNDRTWDEKLSSVQWAINSLRNKTTQKSPQELLYSFTPRDITKNKIILALHDDCDRSVTPEKLEELRLIAAERIRTIREKAKKNYDKKHRKPTRFKIGELVLVENEPPATGTSRKLEPRFKGPFLITADLGHDRYIVEDIPGSKRKQTHYKSCYSSDKMRLFRPIPDEEETESEDDIDEAELDLPRGRDNMTGKAD